MDINPHQQITDVIDMLVPQALQLLRTAGGSLMYGQDRALKLNDPADASYIKREIEHAEANAATYLTRELRELRPQDDLIVNYKDHTETHAGAAGERHLTWHLKPLDGVQNFEHGFSSYSVAMSAVDESRGQVRFAGVYNPGSETAWWVDGRRAWQQRGRRARAEILTPYLLKNLRVVATNYPRDRVVRHAYLAQLPTITDRFAHLRMLGCGTLQGVLVAEARMNAVIEFDVKPSSYLPTRELVRLTDGLSDLIELRDGNTVLIAARQAQDFDLLTAAVSRLR